MAPRRRNIYDFDTCHELYFINDIFGWCVDCQNMEGMNNLKNVT